MKITSNVRQKPKDGFYSGEVIAITGPTKENNNIIVTVTFQSDEIPYTIDKKIFLKPDLSDGFKIDFLMIALGVTPRSIMTDDDGKDVKDYELQDGVGKSTLAYVYSDKYTNIWDFLSDHAGDAERNRLIKAYHTYVAKKEARENPAAAANSRSPF